MAGLSGSCRDFVRFGSMLQVRGLSLQNKSEGKICNNMNVNLHFENKLLFSNITSSDFIWLEINERITWKQRPGCDMKYTRAKTQSFPSSRFKSVTHKVTKPCEKIKAPSCSYTSWWSFCCAVTWRTAEAMTAMTYPWQQLGSLAGMAQCQHRQCITCTKTAVSMKSQTAANQRGKISDIREEVFSKQQQHFTRSQLKGRRGKLHAALLNPFLYQVYAFRYRKSFWSGEDQWLLVIETAAAAAIRSLFLTDADLHVSSWAQTVEWRFYFYQEEQLIKSPHLQRWLGYQLPSTPTLQTPPPPPP